MTTHTPLSSHHAAHAERAGVWTADRIRELGAVTDLPTAASIFGLSRTVAYDLAMRGAFPVPVIRAGSRYRVPVAAILTVLHLPDDTAGTTRLDPTRRTVLDH